MAERWSESLLRAIFEDWLFEMGIETLDEASAFCGGHAGSEAGGDVVAGAFGTAGGSRLSGLQTRPISHRRPDRRKQ
ncbi:MAG: hypothetical protein ACE5KM_08240 [Planctomycetaceae bacterium]